MSTQLTCFCILRLEKRIWRKRESRLIYYKNHHQSMAPWKTNHSNIGHSACLVNGKGQWCHEKLSVLFPVKNTVATSCRKLMSTLFFHHGGGTWLLYLSSAGTTCKVAWLDLLYSKSRALKYLKDYYLKYLKYYLKGLKNCYLETLTCYFCSPLKLPRFITSSIKED